MTKQQAKIIMAFAESDMDIKPAGEKLYMTGANVSYHLTKIRKQMGWNPRNFFENTFHHINVQKR